MEQILANDARLANARAPQEWVKLIRKLRWIGLDEEARRLEAAVSTLAPEDRGSVLSGPVATD